MDQAPEHRAPPAAFLWTALAGALGFAASRTFATLLRWDRARFVLVFALLVAVFVAVYLHATGIRLRTQLRRRWIGGLVGGVLIGALLVRGVLRQPGSPAPSGDELLFALAWFGVVYGASDALLLSVVPVLSIYGRRPAEALSRPASRLAWGMAALAGSLAVTAAYHVGYTEFHGRALLQPLIGNAVSTLGYLLTGSPLAPIVSHILMHGAAVLHGMETTVQLPPHY